MAASFASSSAAYNPWKLGGLSIGELSHRVWTRTIQVELLGRAAQLAFYFLLALFPALLFLTALVGLFPVQSFVPELMNYLRHVLPGDALSLVSKFLEQIMAGTGTHILSLGLLGALWATSSGMTAAMDALNAMYRAKETRSLWKIRAVAIGMTIGLAGFILASITLVLSGQSIGEWMAGMLGLGWLFASLWSIVKWPVVCALMLFAASVIYYVAPNVEQHWKWVTPGSVFGVFVWLIVSLGFKVYVEYFGNYNAVYGSIAGVIVLMLWLYLSGIALLLGGEINATIEKAAATVAKAESKPRPLRRVRA